MPTDPIGDPLAFDPNLLGGAAPFDLSSMMQPQQPPPAAPPQPPQSAGKGKKKGALAEMALAAIAPIIASRHGQAGVAALVNGFQRAQAEQQQTSDRQAQTDFENQRQVQADQRAIEAQQANERYRQQVLQGQQRNAVATLMKNGAAQLAAAETSEDADRIAQGLKMAGGVYGVRPEAMDALIAQNRPAPTALEQKQAQKYIGQLEKTYGQDWAQKVGSATFVLPGAAPDPNTGKPQPITVQQLLAKSGMNISGLPVTAPNTDKRGFTSKDVTVNGKRMLAGYDPDTNQYYAPGDTKTPLAGDIQEYTKPTPANAEGLTPRQQQQVGAQTRTYDTNQVVKNTQTMSEAVAFANSLDPNTTNPADDQALIYAFAKAMDPNSVVREGEYATVQRYAQSWAESFGFNAARIFSNTAFLTPQARQNMKRTIQARFRAAQGQYKAVRDSYIQKINKITGMNDGADWLTDYGAAFPTDPEAATSTGRASVAPPPTSAPARAGGAGPVPNPFRH